MDRVSFKGISHFCFHVARKAKNLLKDFMQDARAILRKREYGPKVFCIGYFKTGTTSLAKALKNLGYHHCGYNERCYARYLKKNQTEWLIDYASKFDSFDDFPWLREDLIPHLDEGFPDSKFVYLERDEASWKRSISKWRYKNFGRTPDIAKAWLGYQNHRDFVLNYFKDKPTQLLVLNINDPKGFTKLAQFLGKTAPNDNFPHCNKTGKVNW